MRLWPGGIALSRSLGDFGVGMASCAAPAIRHVRLPWRGSRVIIASDGVWDAFGTSESVAKYIRKEPADTSASLITKRAMVVQVAPDDASCIVVDIMPVAGMKLMDTIPRSKSAPAARQFLGCLCASSAKLPDQQSQPALPEVEVLGYTDM